MGSTVSQKDSDQSNRKHASGVLDLNDICLIGGFRLLRLLSLEQFLNMLLASLLTLFTLNKRYQSFNRFFYLSVSRFPFGRQVQDSPVDLSQPCELL